MDLQRVLIASLLLVFSGQAMALFMPEEFSISTDTTVVSDGGCGFSVDRLQDSAEH